MTNGYVHQRADSFAKVPVGLLHDLTLTDGAIRLYAHMRWRYGGTCSNFESRDSMAKFLGVSEATISKRIAELVAHDWVIVKERRFGNRRTTNFYHVFEDQNDCRAYRSAHPGSPIQPKPPTAPKPRKMRDGIGGNPSHKSASTQVDPQMSISTQVDLDDTGFNVNSSSRQYLDAFSYPDAICESPTNHVIPTDEKLSFANAADAGLPPTESEIPTQAEFSQFLTALGEPSLKEQSEPIPNQKPEKTAMPTRTKTPPKVAPKGSPPSAEVKNALAVLCYGTADAWRVSSNAKAMGKTLREISGLGEVTLEDMTRFGTYWKTKDWRGQKGQPPAPHQVAAEWVKAQTDMKPAPHVPKADPGCPVCRGLGVLEWTVDNKTTQRTRHELLSPIPLGTQLVVEACTCLK